METFKPEQGPTATFEQLLQKQSELLGQIKDLSIAIGKHGESPVGTPIEDPNYVDFGFYEEREKLIAELKEVMQEALKMAMEEGEMEGRQQKL